MTTDKKWTEKIEIKSRKESKLRDVILYSEKVDRGSITSKWREDLEKESEVRKWRGKIEYKSSE